MRSVQISLPPLALSLALGVAGAAGAAECPVPRPVTGAFHAIQTTAGTVLTYPASPTGTPPANATQVQRGMTLSGTISGLSAGTEGGEMGISLELDLVRFLRTGQGYGSGEITITSRPSVPFLTPATVFRGQINAVLTTADSATGYFAATGAGEFAGSSLRGRFTARLNAAPNPGPGGPPNPFGNPPPNPFGASSPTNPFGVGAPTNPFGPGSGSGTTSPPLGNPTGALRNPFTGTAPNTSPIASFVSNAVLEVQGAFGGADGAALLVEKDPLATVEMADAPDLSPAASGLFPLMQAATGSLSVRCRRGEVTHCSSGDVFPILEGTETRLNTLGAGTISLRAGRSSARYRVELNFESLRTRSVAAESNYGYAQARVRLFGRGTTPIYEGTMDGSMVPVLVRGRPLTNRFLWSGFMVLNQKTPTGGVADSLRTAFTATGSFGKGKVPEISLSATLGRTGDPFLRVVSGLFVH